MLDVSEEIKNDIESFVLLLVFLLIEGARVELAALAASVRSKNPPPPLVPPPTLDYESYYKHNNEVINIRGIAGTAEYMGLDVGAVTEGVHLYTRQQRRVLKVISKKFKEIGIGELNTPQENNQVDNQQKKDVEQICKSLKNSHLVDLLAEQDVKVVAQEQGLTNEELKSAVDNHKKLILSLENKVEEARATAKKLKAASSSQQKPKSQGKRNKGNKKK